jgi:F-type H+-transporting ATPase subunit delta
MNDSKISTRYARALFISARDKNLLSPVRSDMELVLAAIHDLPELKQILESPVIKPREKSMIMKLIFGGKVHDLSMSFFEMIISNKREEYLAGMARSFIRYFKEASGIKIAILKTAVSIDQKLRDHFIKIIKEIYQTEVELTEEVHEHLIGGFILTVEDQQFDASVSGHLNRIRKGLSGSGRQKH